MKSFLSFSVIISGLSILANNAFASEAGVHVDPVSSVLLGLVMVFVAAKVGALLARAIHQPAVLGELLAGVLMGNLSLLGFDHFGFLSSDSVYDIFASLGVILLLFEVGLESSMKELLRVGLAATVVAIVGVLVPSGLGFVLSQYLLPEASPYLHLFIGTTLCATSVGITARVLKDLKQTHRPESRIILGAAIIDDVLGLVILAIVSGLITSLSNGAESNLSLASIVWIATKAIGFLVVACVVGMRLTPPLFRFVARWKLDGSLLTSALIFCFVLAYLANWVGLAPIVGAFAAGLIIDGKEFATIFKHEKSSIESLMHPLSKFFVPIFFVHMGMQVRLETFASGSVLLLGLGLTVVGILGKAIAGYAIYTKQALNRLAIGIGMIPRGEVGLIFAMIGTKLTLNGAPVISSEVYSAIIVMVVLTTMVTPPALSWVLRKK